MHADHALEERTERPVRRVRRNRPDRWNRPDRRDRPDRRRRRGAARPQEGPVFVDASGRRARLLRRAGVALGIVTLGYVAVLGLAFVGGISLSPSQVLPFDGGPAAEGGTGYGPPGGAPPPGAAQAPPTVSPTGSPTAAASAAPSASTAGDR
ncbi:hypothetical protein AB0P17_26415 [Streptomyces sp. NPDC088124]|uniref:hypothetical protein n=1 Tax=Streptomyces sp. NPDC088124 TaxID=3154654 RepID=UPI003430C066